jgi:hypothetical protein
MVRRSFNLAHAGLCLALLIAIFSFAVPALAATGTHGTLAMHLSRPGVAAVADLDGDHIPDVASGINIGHTSAGYSYRVDFDLSSGAEPKSFSVFSEEPSGLNIEAIDVDGDEHLDIVITGRLSLRPIGIWINDGSGRFTPRDLERYVFSGWQTRRSITAPSIPLASAVRVEWRRPQIELSREGVDLLPSGLSLLEARASSAGYSRVPAGSTHLRAPPILSN